MEHLFSDSLAIIIEVALTGKSTASKAILEHYEKADLIVKHTVGKKPYGLRPTGRKLLAEALRITAKAAEAQLSK